MVMTPNFACMENVTFGLQPQSDFINVDSMGILNIDVSQERLNQQFFFTVTSPSGSVAQFMFMLNVIAPIQPCSDTDFYVDYSKFQSLFGTSDFIPVNLNVDTSATSW